MLIIQVIKLTEKTKQKVKFQTSKALANFTDYVVQDFVLDNLYTSNIEFKSRYLWNSTNQSFLHV